MTKNKERALAHVEEIAWIKPIEGANNIELIGVLGWQCIAKKEEFNVGDKCVYIEIDSKCPKEDERFAFLESKGYKVKTMKLGKFGVISQGLALPITLFSEITDKPIGTDVTKELKITYSSLEDQQRKGNGDPEAKYKSMKARHPKLFQNKFIKKMMKYKWFKQLMFVFFGKKSDKPKAFPDWIVKTDETRIENATFYLKSTDMWICSEKLDGTSTSYSVDFTKKKPDFAVCSRNVRQADRNQKNYHSDVNGANNVYWEMADKYDVENVLKDIAKKYDVKRIVLQGETYGASLQGNPYKMDHRDFAAFNLIFDGDRLNSIKAKEILAEYGVPFVPILDEVHELPHTMEEMKAEAEGYSVINPKVKREGIVYRSLDGKGSFKNVAISYLLKHNG